MWFRCFFLRHSHSFTLLQWRTADCETAGPSCDWDCCVGLVVKVSTSRVEDPWFIFCLHCGDFSWSSHTSDLNIGAPVASLPGVWCYRVSTGTGWLGVSILWLGEMESLNCNFCLSVAACKIEQIHPWDTLACCRDIKQPTNKLVIGITGPVLVLVWSRIPLQLISDLNQ